MFISELKKLRNLTKGKYLYKYFKCDGGYGDPKDIFLGVAVPDIRKLANKYYRSVDDEELLKYLRDPVHEVRMGGFLMLMKKYKEDEKKLLRIYLKNVKYLNNWDLVDLTTPEIIGNYIEKYKDRKLLLKFAKSSSLWEKRIAIVATNTLIRKNKFKDTLMLAKKFQKDPHPLIHKAIGWMLREIGKRDESVLVDYLDKNHHKMNRIEVSYAIERLKTKEKYLLKNFKSR